VLAIVPYLEASPQNKVSVVTIPSGWWLEVAYLFTVKQIAESVPPLALGLHNLNLESVPFIKLNCLGDVCPETRSIRVRVAICMAVYPNTRVTGTSVIAYLYIPGLDGAKTMQIETGGPGWILASIAGGCHK
jgi:hypothetical protein